MEHSLAGWSVERFNQVAWVPWGGSGANARAKVLGNSDGYFLTLIEAEAGYRGDPHEHAYPEFLYVIDGSVRTQGQTMTARRRIRSGSRLVTHRFRDRLRGNLRIALQAVIPHQRRMP